MIIKHLLRKNMYFTKQFLSFLLIKILYFQIIIFTQVYGKKYYKPAYRILGGRLAEVRRFPFMVSIQYRWPDFDDETIVMPFCGGSIIGNKWILTAAHCTRDIKDLYVKAGAIDAEEDHEEHAQIVGIKEAFKHPLFTEKGGISEFDIALLELTNKLQFNEFIQPIHLPPENYMPTGYGDIIGWGTTDPTAQLSSQHLLQAHVKLMPIGECQKIYEKVTNNHICPGEIGKSSCAGDSGGPFIQRIRGRKCVVGVTSFGKRPCGKTPEAYMRVSAFVNSFILPTIQNNTNEN